MLSLRSPALATGALLLLPSFACSGDRGRPAPAVTLASSGGAQAEYRQLRARFFDADPRGRAALAPALGDFLARWPRDERAASARVLLAFAYLERGERPAARAALAPALREPSGSLSDFARVAEAAIVARDGDPRRALVALDALEGRIVDLDERFVYGEERARAAFLAGDYAVALRALLAWLVQSPPDRHARARASASTLIGLVPEGDLVRALAAPPGESADAANPDLEGGRAWLVGAMVSRLTRVALERSDAELARRLLEVAPAALRATPDGQRLVALASSGHKAPAVAGRAVGLLLGLGDALARQRAAAVTAGMTRALGSARTRTAASGVELVVRYGTEDVPTAFTALAADGAALVVAGADDETARRAAAQAETLRLPVLLLRPPAVAPPPLGFTFVLGTSDAPVEAALSEALGQRGCRHVERVGFGGTSCDSEASAPGKPRFPLAAWQASGVDALLVNGDASCARDLADELDRARKPWPVALGLDASGAYATLGRSVLVARAGAYPESAPSGGWYEALGLDAGILAARALEALPPQGIARGEDVETLREKARDALARAEGALVTSSASGFGGRRVLPREISVAPGGANEAKPEAGGRR